VAAFQLSPEEGDDLVPRGILSVKFSSQGTQAYDLRQVTAYLDADGIGKGSTFNVQTTSFQQSILYGRSKIYIRFYLLYQNILLEGADVMIPGGQYFSN
jgi:hypothetical protein